MLKSVASKRARLVSPCHLGAWLTRPSSSVAPGDKVSRKHAPSSSTRPTTLPPPTLDLARILARPDSAKHNLKARKFPLDAEAVDEICRAELKAVGLRKELQAARESRNAASRNVNDAEGRKAGAAVKALVKDLESRLAATNSTVHHLAVQLPNSAHPSSPIGPESCARVVKTFGPAISDPSPPPDPARDHLHVASPAQLNWIDFPSSALTSGASWPLLLNDGALLELALTNYAMSVALSKGFAPVLTPDVVRSDIAERCGFRPRDEEAQQTYFLGDGKTAGDTLCLAGTAEVPLVGMAAATTFKASDLPLRRVALGRAFRAEAGARGADSRGLYRVHQFSKVEMVVLCSEEDSGRLLEELRAVQEHILSSLGLSLRVLDMPTEELGASAHRKYDIEAWMPGRGKWGELSSASNCTDFQSRRLGIKYRPVPSPPAFPTTSRSELEDLCIPTPAALEATALYPQLSSQEAKTKPAFVHTLNATAAAIPRLIVAIIENGVVLDKATGEAAHIRLPDVLKRFWIGREDRIRWVKAGEPLKLDEQHAE